MVQLNKQQIEDLIKAVDCWKHHHNTDEARVIRERSLKATVLSDALAIEKQAYLALKEERKMKSDVLTAKLTLMKHEDSWYEN